MCGSDGHARIGRGDVDWAYPLFSAVTAMLCTGFAAGFRKAGIPPSSGSPDSTFRSLRRNALSWIIGGVPVADPTAAQLRALRSGDFCVVKFPPCKKDTPGLHFGWKLIWLPVFEYSVDSARALPALILAVPIDPELSADTPLFCVNEGGVPLTQAVATRICTGLLMAAFPDEDHSRWSLHSLRIGLACTPLKVGGTYGPHPGHVPLAVRRKRQLVRAPGPGRSRPLGAPGLDPARGLGGLTEPSAHRVRQHCLRSRQDGPQARGRLRTRTDHMAQNPKPAYRRCPHAQRHT